MIRSRAFNGPDFVLSTDLAAELYHTVAEPLPIIDYHCHLSPADVAEDTRFRSMAHVWLNGDHYKWRAMRTTGIAEARITGSASDRDRFDAWCETVPKCLRNPLYHWTHLELKKPFGMSDVLLSPSTADTVWERGNALLATPEFSARGLMRQWQVQVVCTTDDPADDLAHHAAYRTESGWHQAGSTATQMRPTWRPDRAAAIDDSAPWNAWCDRLALTSGIATRTFDGFLAAFAARHAAFHALGCRVSDHGLETVHAESCTDADAARIFHAARSGHGVTTQDIVRWRSWLLVHGARMDHAAGWVQQFHIGPIRNTATRLTKLLGGDAGVDSIGDANYAKPLATFLDTLDREQQLAKTILYNINPRDNEMLATMCGNFQGDGIAGKIQFGSGWWFLDQMDGMRKQLDALSNLSLLAIFVGMLTDSRSFLSYSRHEYFRRILCDQIGRDVAAGYLPDDRAALAQLVHDVCYGNAARYFDFGLPLSSSKTA